MAPFGTVSFFTAFLGDVLTSLAKVNTDLGFTACFLLSGRFLHEADVGHCTESFAFKNAVKPLLIALPLVSAALPAAARACAP